MSTRERARDRGRRLGLRVLAELGEELRRARLSRGASQAELGSAAGVSRSKAARYESGRHLAASLVEMSQLLAAAGLGLKASTYPLGDGPRDSRHAAGLAGFLAHAAPPLSWRTEVPLPNAGDARAWDALITGAGRRTGVEYERVLHDIQGRAVGWR